MSSQQNSWNNLLCQWWGGGDGISGSAFGLFCGGFLSGQASNLVFGGNPVYQIDDFLAFYPKFGIGTLGVAALSLGAGGTGYSVNDILTLIQPDAQGCTIKVLSLSSGGVILTWTQTSQGTGYSVPTPNVPLVTTGGTGTGATFSVLVVTPTSTVIPPAVIQAYINLASASLSINRWGDLWLVAMGLYVAHFVTLYEQSEGSVTQNSTPAAIARSGLATGILVSASAGDVSKTVQILESLADWGAFSLTIYGQQLATWAKMVGMGTSYIRGL